MMCSPLVADPYFSAQAAITHSPSKLAPQIGVLRQRRAHCDAASVPQLRHIDQVYRIALEGAGYHTTSTAAYTSRRAAPGGPAVPSSRRRSGIHLHDVAGDRRADGTHVRQRTHVTCAVDHGQVRGRQQCRQRLRDEAGGFGRMLAPEDEYWTPDVDVSTDRRRLVDQRPEIERGPLRSSA